MANTSDNKQTGAAPVILAGLSILSCYGTLALVSALGLIGIQLNIHEGAWATVITLLAWLATISIGFESHRNRAIGPIAVAILGALLITAVMFVSYSRIVEITGFVLILAAVFWSRWHTKRQS